MPASVERYPLCAADYPFCEKQQVAVTFVLDFGSRLDFESLRESLAATLRRFPILKGRLVDEGGEYVVIDDVGGPFGSATFELREGPEPEPDNPAALLEYVAPIEAKAGNPVARFALIHTPHGSVLSASVAHAVSDGFSYFFFLTTWAALTRGAEMPLPAYDREPLVYKGSDYGDLSPEAVLRKTGYYLVEELHRPAPIARLGTIRWSDEEIAQHRADGEREVQTKLSDNNLFTALLLKDCAQRRFKSGDTIHLHTPLDYRRLVPQIAPLYFGNATRGVPFEARYDDIMDNTVAQLALRLKTGVAEVTRPAIDEHLKTIQGLKVTGGIELARRLHSWHPRYGTLITNLTRMPVEQINFGLGAPRQLCSCPTAGPGCYVLLRRPGATEAVIGLEA